MPTVESPTVDELEQRSTELVAVLTAASVAVASNIAAEIAAQPVAALAVTTGIPALWATYTTGKALDLIVDAYLDAAGSILEVVDPGRVFAFPLISERTAEQFALQVRARLSALGDDMQRAARTEISTMPWSSDTPRQSFAASVADAMQLRTSRLDLVSRSEILSATQAGMLAQSMALAEHFDITRTWRSQHDDRTRQWHRAANGQRVGVTDAFHVGNSWLLAPGVAAPGKSLDVGDLCNCRCVVTYSFDIITETNDVGTRQEASVSERQPGEASLIAAAAKWNPSAHPRGKDGKFIKKGALSTLLSKSKLNLLDVSDGVASMDGAQWNNLTDAQKSYISDVVEKLPHGSDLYKQTKTKLDSLSGASSAPSAPSAPSVTAPVKAIPAHKGAAPGSQAKVSTALVWGKYDNGDVILESSDGAKRVIWDGNVKKYATQSKIAAGKWKTDQFDTKKDFYANEKTSSDWVVPGKTQDSPTVMPLTEPVSPVSFTPSTQVDDVTPAVLEPTGVSPSEPLDPNAPGGYTLSTTVLNSNTLSDLLEQTPSNSVIAWQSTANINYLARISKNGDGNFVYEKMNDDGAWVTSGPPITTDNVIFTLSTSSNWKLNPELMPSADQPSGDAVDDWAKHLSQSFNTHDVVATHESGLARVVYSGGTALGATYNLQKLNVSTGEWTTASYETNLATSFFSGGQLNVIYAGSWIAGTSSAPSVASTADVPGGKPLIYDSYDDVIDNWPHMLLVKKYNHGDVVSPHADGKMRLVAQGDDNNGKPIFALQAWNDSTKQWEFTQDDYLTAVSASKAVNAYGGDWLTPLPNGKQYEQKTTTTIPSVTTPSVTAPSVTTPSPTAVPAAPAPSVLPSSAPSSPLGGSDISGIASYVKSAMKSVLKAQNVGYWSKPEKIWDAVKQIQQNYPDSANSGHSKYSPMQVFKALDSTLKTTNPSPFETKMVKWAASPKGQAYIKNSMSMPSSSTTVPTPSVATPTPTATSTKKFPTITSNFNYATAWGSGKPVTSSDVAALVSSAQHLDVVAIHVKGSVEHRVIRSTDDPTTGAPRFYVQSRDNVNTAGWDLVTKPGMNTSGLMTTAAELDTYFPDLKFRSTDHVAIVPTTPAPTTSTVTPTLSATNVGSATDDISHLTPAQKSDIYAKFKSHSGTYLSSPELGIFNALKSTATSNNLSIMQTIKVIDAVGAEKVGATNTQLFENKISKWLTTKQGTLAVGGKGMSKTMARQVDYSPGISPDKIPDFAESSKLEYHNMSVHDAHKFEKEVLKQDVLPASQTNALKSYTGGVYNQINSYLYGTADTITTTNINTAKNVQKAMRPSDRPILLHRGVNYNGIANSAGFEDLQSKVGQTWMSGGFFSTSVGSKSAFSYHQVALEIEAPPGTPMAWMERLIDGPYGKKPLTKYPGENEMLLAAGLSYRIVSVKKDLNGKTVVRLRVVPPSEEVTV